MLGVLAHVYPPFFHSRAVLGFTLDGLTKTIEGLLAVLTKKQHVFVFLHFLVFITSRLRILIPNLDSFWVLWEGWEPNCKGNKKCLKQWYAQFTPTILRILVLQVFTANSDRHTIVTNTFPKSIAASYIRIHPMTWYGWMSMRVDFIGCSIGKWSN